MAVCWVGKSVEWWVGLKVAMMVDLKVEKKVSNLAV